LVSWRTLSQSRATSFSERGLGIGCYSASRPLLMLLLLPFSQQAPSVRCALHGRARGPAENSDRGGDSAIPPLWKNPGASIGLSNRRMPRRQRSGGIAGIVSHNPMDGGCVTSVDRHQMSLCEYPAHNIMSRDSSECSVTFGFSPRLKF